MKTSFRQSFVRDLRKVKDRHVLQRVEAVIMETEAASTLADIEDLKKLKGHPNCFRIRVGEWRIGIIIEADTVEFVRFFNRRDLYRYFP